MIIPLDKLDCLNSDQIAAVLGVSRRQLRNLVAVGMPSKGLGRKRHFDWNQVRPWYFRRKILEGMSLKQEHKAAMIRLMSEPL